MSLAVVRAASPESATDVDALAVLRFAWRHDERGEAGDLATFAPAFRDWWRSHAATHRAWLADLDGRPVGMAWLAIVHRVPGPQWFDRTSGIVQSVYVRAEVRGAGVGAELLSAVIAASRDHGLGYLGVHPSERSYGLYERAGFEATRAVLELGLTEPRRAPR